MKKFLLFFVLTSCSTQQHIYSGHTLEDLDQSIVKKYAPKNISKNLKNKIERYMDIRGARSGVMTPDGKKMFFSWNVTGTSQVWMLNGPNTFPRQMTAGDQPIYVSGTSIDGKFIYLTKDNNGDEYYGFYRQSVNGGVPEKLFHKKNVKASLDYIEDSGKFLYFKSNEKDSSNMNIYKLNLATKTYEIVFDKKGTWSIRDKKGELLLLKNSTGNTFGEYFVYNEKNKKLIPLLGQGEKEDYSIKFSARESEYLVLTNKFSNFKRLYTYKNNKFNLLSDKLPFDVSNFSIDKKRRRIYYAFNKNGYMKIKARNAKTLKNIRVPEFSSNDDVFYLGHTRNAKYSIIGVETPTFPRKVFVYNWDSGKKVVWSYPSYPEVDLNRVVGSKLEYFTSRDGTKIPMFVWRPRECVNRSCPVVVNFHGGPESQAWPGFSSYAKMYNDEGIIFVRPNVRGSRGYGKEYLNSDNGPKRLKVITDIQDCAIFIKKNWNKTGDFKIGISGGSYGGYSTLIGMTMFAGTYDAGVSIVGMSSLVSFLKNTADYRRHLRESEYGYLKSDMDELIALSPITYIDKVSDPILIIQGANDPRVPAGESIQIQQILEDKGLDSELILFQDEGHGVRKRHNRVLSWGATLEFFKKHLF